MSVSKEALRSYGNRLVGDLQVYLRSLHTHDVNNAIVVRARNALFRTLEEHFEEEPDTALHVQLLPEETFINGTLLPVAMADFGRILELTGQLRTIGVGEIVFLPGVTTDELSSFARAIFQCMHKRTPIDTRDFGHIRALELEYSAVGSAERDSHQVAIWLFTGLLDGLDGLEELVAEGHRPTMAPFMRHMRLLIDLDQEHRYVIQHLCLARRPAVENGRHPLACRTFLVVSAGHQLGMTRSDLMAVGLASILDLVTNGTPPERMVAKLLNFPTLSDLAPSVMIILRDLERIRTGQEGGRRAQLLAAVDRLTSAVHGETPTTLAAVRTDLESAVGLDPELVSGILSWLGDVPIGTVVRTDAHPSVLVYDHGRDGEALRGRPIELGILGPPAPIVQVDHSHPITFSSDLGFALPLEEEQEYTEEVEFEMEE